MSTLRRVVTGFAVVSSCLTLSTPVYATPAAHYPLADARRATRRPATPLRAAVAATVPREAVGAKYLRDALPTNTLTFSIILPVRHRADLDALIAAQNDATSARYRRWLKKGEFARRFSADPQAVAVVESALIANGATIERTNDAKTVITASAAVGNVEKLFGTRIGEFAGANRRFFANTAPALHPAAFHNTDVGVVGLDNIAHVMPLTTGYKSSALRGKSARGALRKVGPTWASGGAGGYTPDDLAKAYDYPWKQFSNAAGAGATIGIVMEGDFLASDLLTWYANDVAQSHVPTNWPTRIPVDGGGSFDPSSSIEVTVDVEQSTSLAPQASELVYETPDLSNQSIVDAYSAVVADDAADVVSSSFGGCEQFGAFDEILDELFAAGAAQGQSFFASSGDQGSACYPSYRTGASMPASDSYVTAVGGSTLLTGQTGEYGGEVAWSSSGGGVSGEWWLPNYQMNFNGYDVAQFNSTNPFMRNLPDIALNSDDINSPDEVYFNGAEGTAGGTSFASPAAAAEYAIIDGFNSRVGLPQTRLYWLGMNRSFPLHEVMSGCNNAYAPGYCAGYGYDLVTGWGSFDAAALFESYADLILN